MKNHPWVRVYLQIFEGVERGETGEANPQTDLWLLTYSTFNLNVHELTAC